MKQHIYLQQMGIAEAEDYLLSSPLQSLKADASTIAGVEDDCIIFYKSAWDVGNIKESVYIV